MSTSIDQQFIEFIVKSLVGNPDAVKVERRIDEKGVLLELTVDGEDLGRVIGKRGATAQSLRTLLRALGTKNDARYNLKIVDVNGGPGGTPRSEDDRAPDQFQRSEESHISEDTETDQPTVHSEEVATEDEAVVAEADAEVSEEPVEPQAPVEPKAPTYDSDDNSDAISKTRKELEDLDDLDL